MPCGVETSLLSLQICEQINIFVDYHCKSLSLGVICYEAIFLYLIFLLVLLKDIYYLVATLRGFSLVAMKWLLLLQSMVCRVHRLQ